MVFRCLDVEGSCILLAVHIFFKANVIARNFLWNTVCWMCHYGSTTLFWKKLVPYSPGSIKP